MKIRHPEKINKPIIVENKEGQALNKKWCKKDYPTNVLSFPITEKIKEAPNILGDIVICANVVLFDPSYSIY